MPPELEILFRYLNQPFPAKTVFVSPVHNTNRQGPESMHRINVLIYVGPGEVCEKWAVIDGITGKEHPRLFFPKPNTARRVTRQMQDLEYTIAEINHVPL